MKELALVGVESTPSLGPYVTLSLLDRKSFKPRTAQHSARFGIGFFLEGPDYTTIRMSLPEYRASGLAVGDRVMLEVNSLESDEQRLARVSEADEGENGGGQPA